MQVKGVYKQAVNRLVIGIQDQMDERCVIISKKCFMLLAGSICLFLLLDVAHKKLKLDVVFCYKK